MSSLDQMTDAEREAIRARVAQAPPLSDRQKAVIRAAFGGAEMQEVAGDRNTRRLPDDQPTHQQAGWSVPLPGDKPEEVIHL